MMVLLEGVGRVPHCCGVPEELQAGRRDPATLLPEQHKVSKHHRGMSSQVNKIDVTVPTTVPTPVGYLEEW